MPTDKNPDKPTELEVILTGRLKIKESAIRHLTEEVRTLSRKLKKAEADRDRFQTAAVAYMSDLIRVRRQIGAMAEQAEEARDAVKRKDRELKKAKQELSNLSKWMEIKGLSEKFLKELNE